MKHERHGRCGGPQAVRREFDKAAQPPVRLVRPRLTLVTTTAAVLAEQDFPPVAFVVPGYIAEGLTVIAGRPKTGKSWLALGWAAAVADGGMAFGSIPVEAGDVLYLALEDNQRRLKGRLKQMTPDASSPARLHLTTQCPRGQVPRRPP
jgi:hypothetical protein